MGTVPKVPRERSTSGAAVRVERSVSSPWAPIAAPVSGGAGIVTLVDGQTFCLSERTGDLQPGTIQGVFFADLRVLSGARLLVDGRPLELLTVAPEGAFAATFVARTTSAHGDHHRLLVVRRRVLGSVMDETIELRNLEPRTRPVSVDLALDVDFADLFSVKDGRVEENGERAVQGDGASIIHSWHHDGVRRQVRVSFDGPVPAEVTAGAARWQFAVPGHETVTIRWSVDVAFGTQWLSATAPTDAGGAASGLARSRMAEWEESAPVLRTDHTGLSVAFSKAISDLGALRLFDPHRRRPPAIAAGAPWFMTLFGRDSLITGSMALPVDPTLALGVLHALAELQGDTDDPRTEEEPGRIMHETRFLRSSSPSLAAGRVYYGTVDATPLFVMLLGELSRWGLPDVELQTLLPHADRAMDWIERRMRADERGYLTYRRTSPRGLANQGWKDSWDGVRYHDGRVAEAPIALSEVQAYVYAALVARAELAQRVGDAATASSCRASAARLKTAFNRDFWDEDLGWLAIALDHEGRRVDSLASNMGHCLWTGIVDDDHAARVADRLVRGPMWSGWGIRTLAADEPAYDPTSYHCGSVWPHDNALCAAGLARHGHLADAHRVITAMLDASAFWDGRLPELFCGVDRSDIASPVPYPTSCSPQAWAAASPLLFLRIILGMNPDVPRGTCSFRPSLPAGTTSIVVRGLRLWDASLDVTVDRDGVVVEGLPAGVTLDV